jgi:hypothetical protein
MAQMKIQGLTQEQNAQLGKYTAVFERAAASCARIKAIYSV